MRKGSFRRETEGQDRSQEDLESELSAASLPCSLRTSGPIWHGTRVRSCSAGRSGRTPAHRPEVSVLSRDTHMACFPDKAKFIRSVTDLLRGGYKQADHGKVMA